jgi:predicted nucleotidyltransferase
MQNAVKPAQPAAADVSDIERLRGFLAARPEVELAILVGSRANGEARPDSDWDIAIRFSARESDLLAHCGRLETLRRELAGVLGKREDAVDLIDLPGARLAMRALVAEEGLPLKGEDSLAWGHFLTRTWRDLEDFYWEQTHAA